MKTHQHKRRRLDANRFVDIEAEVSEEDSDSEEPTDDEKDWLTFMRKSCSLAHV